MTKILLFLMVTFSAFANLQLAPPSFKYKNGKAVFMDIQKGLYKIDYYPSTFRSRVKTTWEFELKEEGYPLFDFVPWGIRAKLDGKRVRLGRVRSPDRVTKYRVIRKKLKLGKYKLELYTRVKRGITYGFRSVNSGFFIKDLSQKKFLEKYVPANLEFDQYPITFDVRVKSKKKHVFVANGKRTRLGYNHYKIEYPDYYSSSSVYFHVFKVGRYKWLEETFTSINGNKVPVIVYTKKKYSPEVFMAKAREYFDELESDYGAYAQKEILIYGMAKGGGMEYPGATATSLRSLGHEMFHFYFAKSVIPADGNSGWMDEGLASWRDKGYKSFDHPGYEMFNLGAHSVYKRNTDSNSYRIGRKFFAYLNSKFDLKSALKGYYEKYKNSLVTTGIFINYLEEQTGLSLEGEFFQFVLNPNHRKNFVERVFNKAAREDEHDHHPHYSQSEMKNIL
jgi:hypothetical protein